METFLQDIRYGLRMMKKNPGFTLIAILTLALGIGANTAIFSVVNAVLLRPLPLPDSDRILRVQEDHGHPMNLSGATFRDVHERNHVFSCVAAYRIFVQNLTATRETMPPEEIETAFVSQDFLLLTGTQPVIGRGFTREQFRSSAEGAVILSHRLWQRHYGSDPSILDRVVLLHGKPCVVVGVMPAGFAFPEDVEAWAPLSQDLAFPENRRAHLFTTLARLKPGVSPDQARGDLQAISAQIEQENLGVDPGFTVVAQGLKQNMVASVRPALLILLSAVSFVLLIACANVANLLLSRAAARQKEIAVRTALGAARLRLAGQLLTESVLLGFLGGGLGCMLGFWAVKLLAKTYPAAVPRLAAPVLDARILLFALAVSLLSAMLFGIAPALQLTNLSVSRRLVEGGRSTQSVSRQRLTSALVISEVALALVLLAGAGLLVKSFVLLQRVDPGYDPSRVLVASVTLPEVRYSELQQRLRFVDAVLERFRGLPGVQAAAATGALPFLPTATTDFEVEDHNYAPGEEPEAQVLTASPEYFRAMGIRVLSGRTFTPADILVRPTAVVVNQTMAQRFWPNESAIGKRLVMKDWGPPLPGEVVGVVSDVKQDSLDSLALPQTYYSLKQFPENTLTTYLLVRTPTTSPALAAALRQQIWSIDREQPVTIYSLQQVISDSLQRQRFVLTLLGTFSGLAVLLAMIGIYGVIAYWVEQRTHEFGIRMALGAQQRRLVAMVLGESLRVVVAGVALGLAAAFGLTRLLKSLLYGVHAADPLTFSVMTAFLLLVAVAASYLPARRAAKVDPMVALRYE